VSNGSARKVAAFSEPGEAPRNVDRADARTS
jgi:hypothetical protein